MFMLKKMMEDEKAIGMATTLFGILDIFSCINPISWLCCGPCVLTVEMIPAAIMDVMLWPIECLTMMMVLLACGSECLFLCVEGGMGILQVATESGGF